MDKTLKPYGSWKSPITSDFIVGATISLAEASLEGEDIYWLEGRPSEGGRYVLVRRMADGQTQDITPQGYNVRSTVHEYAGGAYVIDRGVVYFSNFADQRLYRQRLDGQPQA